MHRICRVSAAKFLHSTLERIFGVFPVSILTVSYTHLYGDTTVLSTATASKEPREGIDFFPLSVEYEEKMYAVGKIPGGFNKREGKASEHAILTSRVIDRPMRPLFPKDYRNDVTLVDMVMSCLLYTSRCV